jgi:SAM-dependent methyltransferase
MIEIACGPARHLHEFSKKGAIAFGLDQSPEMCAYAESLLDGRSFPQFTWGNMCDFQLEQKVDLVLLAINSVHHLLELDQLLSMFQCVSKHMNTGSLFIIEASRHPAVVVPGGAVWRQERLEDYVDAEWCWNNDIDTVRLDGVIKGEPLTIEDQFPMQRWQADNLIEAAQAAGLGVCGYFGDFERDLEGLENKAMELTTEEPLHNCLLFRPSS